MDSQLLAFTCKVCNVTCTGPENLSQHMIGAKHLKKVRQSNLASEVPSSSSGVGPSSSSTVGEAPDSRCHRFSCALCQTVMSGPDQYQAHMVGKMHAKKVKQIEMMQMIKKEPNPSLGKTDDSLQSSSACPEPTNKTNEDPNERLANLSLSPGLKHSNFCDLCQVVMSGPENVEQHYSGSRHRKMVNKMAECGSPYTGSRNLTFTTTPLTLGNINRISSEFEKCDILEIGPDEDVTSILRSIFEQNSTRTTRRQVEDTD